MESRSVTDDLKFRTVFAISDRVGHRLDKIIIRYVLDRVHQKDFIAGHGKIRIMNEVRCIVRSGNRGYRTIGQRRQLPELDICTGSGNTCGLCDLIFPFVDNTYHLKTQSVDFYKRTEYLIGMEKIPCQLCIQNDGETVSVLIREKSSAFVAERVDNGIIITDSDDLTGIHTACFFLLKKTSRRILRRRRIAVLPWIDDLRTLRRHSSVSDRGKFCCIKHLVDLLHFFDIKSPGRLSRRGSVICRQPRSQHCQLAVRHFL